MGAVLQPRVLSRQDGYRIGMLRIEAGTHLSPEMEPVDSPRIFLVGPESIGFVGRDDDVLVLFNPVFLSFYPVPSFAVCTVDQHTIVASFVFLYKMVLHLRKKSYLSYVQVAYKRILTVLSKQLLGQGDGTFAFKSFFDLYHYSIVRLYK